MKTWPHYSALQSTTPVLLCTTKYYSILQSTTPVRLLFYKVLLQYDSANIALVRTTKYSSILGRPTPYYAPYYKVLLQYYSVLQSTTVLHTTKHYSTTTRSDTPTWPNIAACQEKWHRNSSCGHKRPKIAVTSDQNLRSQATPRPKNRLQRIFTKPSVATSNLCIYPWNILKQDKFHGKKRVPLQSQPHPTIGWQPNFYDFSCTSQIHTSIRFARAKALWRCETLWRQGVVRTNLGIFGKTWGELHEP